MFPIKHNYVVGKIVVIESVNRNRRKIYKDVYVDSENQKLLSTVFLCFSHGKDECGRNLLFETIYFPDTDVYYEQFVYRHATKEEALKCHEACIVKINGGFNEAKQKEH